MLQDFSNDGRGSVGVLSALLVTVFCLISAIAIDVGSVALEARRLQGAADIAAQAAAANLDQALDIADRTASANAPDSDVEAEIALGLYVPDRSLAPAQRFTPNTPQVNAVRVTLTRTTPIYFGRLIMGTDRISLTRSATAAAVDVPRAMFSIGSRLARLDGGVANQVLSAMTGSSVSLSLMDYDALADADVNLLAFSRALAAELDVKAGDYDSLFQRTLSVGSALTVLEGLAGDQADSALSKLAAQSFGLDLTLGELIGAEAGAGDGLESGLDANVSALDLATAMLEIGGGDRQAKLGLAVPAGIADLGVSLAIGERPNGSPWLTVTAKGDPIIRTAQARLYIKARTAQTLSGLAQVNLPVLIDLAASEARLKTIACDPARSITVDVRPGIARASIGIIDETKLDNFKHGLTPVPATLLSVLGLVTIKASAHVEAADQGYTPLTFSDAEITAQAVKSVRTTGAVNGIIVSLLRNMQVDVKVVGLGLGLGNLTQALGLLLTPLGPVLDAAINPVLDTLGLKFGEADVQALGASCTVGRPMLVG